MTLFERLLKVEKSLNDIICRLKKTNPSNNEIKHNKLDGLQGGGTDEYYHLTKDQHDNLGNGSSGSTLNSVGSDLNVGNISIGQEIVTGTDLETFISLLINKINNPIINNPYVRISTNIPELIEIGTPMDVTVTSKFNRGSIMGSTTGTWNPNYNQGLRSGNPTKHTINNVGQLTTNLDVSETYLNYRIKPTQTYDVTVNYLSGTTQPKNSKGENFNNILIGGSVSHSIEVKGSYRSYAGPSSNEVPTLPTLFRTQLGGISTLNSFPVDHTINTDTTSTLYVVAVPSPRTLLSAQNDSTNEILNFLLSTTITYLIDAQGVSVPYNVYIMRINIPFSKINKIKLKFN